LYSGKKEVQSGRSVLFRGEQCEGGLPSAGLGGNSRRCTVTGIDTRAGGKGEKCVERVHEPAERAAGQVRSAVAHAEQGVAGEEDSIFRKIEADRTWRVARRVKDGDTAPLLV